nr:HD domain-containing protein [uncultured Holophaga sp.]
MSTLRPWREACREAIQTVSAPDALQFWGVGHEVDGHTEAIFDYRFEHTLAVVRIARWLATSLEADLEVVECAAWLHDVRKFLRDAKGKDLHGQAASEAVEEILQDTDFPREKIPAVRHAIEHHVGLRLGKRLKPLETACLWDADKLSKLGAASLVHFTAISGAFQPVTTEGILARGESWLELARDIVRSMNTKPAKKEAKRRLAFLVGHYEQLRREWSDPMRPCRT